MAAWLTARGWRDVIHDVTCAGVQIDLIGRAPSGTLTLVEVKMQTASECAHLSRAQLGRLARAAACLAELEPVQLAAAFVEGDKIRLLPVDALTPF